MKSVYPGRLSHWFVLSCMVWGWMVPRMWDEDRKLEGKMIVVIWERFGHFRSEALWKHLFISDDKFKKSTRKGSQGRLKEFVYNSRESFALLPISFKNPLLVYGSYCLKKNKSSTVKIIFLLLAVFGVLEGQVILKFLINLLCEINNLLKYCNVMLGYRCSNFFTLAHSVDSMKTFIHNQEPICLWAMTWTAAAVFTRWSSESGSPRD